MGSDEFDVWMRGCPLLLYISLLYPFPIQVYTMECHPLKPTSSTLDTGIPPLKNIWDTWESTFHKIIHTTEIHDFSPQNRENQFLYKIVVDMYSFWKTNRNMKLITSSLFLVSGALNHTRLTYRPLGILHPNKRIQQGLDFDSPSIWFAAIANWIHFIESINLTLVECGTWILHTAASLSS